MKGTNGLTPPQSHYVLENLVSTGRIKVRLVHEILDGRRDEIRSLEQRLATLKKLDGRVRAHRAATTRQFQQGQYLSTMRVLTKRDRAKVKATLKREGIEAALKMGKELAS